MIHQETYEPRISDYNENGVLSLEAILDIAENAGNHHAAKVNDDVIAGSQRGIAWVLAEWNVCIRHRPRHGERLHIKTWVRAELSATTTSRDIVMSNDAGEECILLCAKFVLFDMQTRRPTRITPEIFAAYQPEEAVGMDFGNARLREPSDYESETVLTLRRTDADFNGHVHNARYISLALESLPSGTYKSDRFASFRIVYRLPLTAGETVTLRCHAEGGNCVTGFYRQDGMLSTIIEINSNK